jgi:WD40 repeat protein
MPDVFISYSRKDEVFVRRLHQALARLNRDVWVDWEDIPLTADWWREIQSGIEAADTFIFVISPDSARSEVCYNEVDHANTHKKRIVPIVVRSPSKEDQQYLHPAVNRHNWVYINDDDRFDQDFERLVSALDTNLAYVREHTRLLVRAREWDQRGRDPSLLLRGRDLQSAENLLMESAQYDSPKPTDLQTAYIFSSRTAANRLQRRTLLSVLFGFVAAVGLAVVAFVSFQQSQANLLRARQTQSLFLADLSRQQRETEDYRTALLLALEAVRHFPEVRNGESNRALLDALTGPAYKQITLRHAVGPVSGTRWNQDESRILSVADNVVQVWDARSGDVTLTLQHGAAARGGLWNQDESRLLTWSADGTARVWDPFIENELLTLTHSAPVNGAMWTPAGIATWADDGLVRFWNAANGTLLLELAHDGPVLGVLWRAESRQILAWAGNQVHVWTLAEDFSAIIQHIVLMHGDQVNGAIWDAAGSRVLSWSRDSTARIWDAASGQILQLLPHDRTVNGALWNAANSRLLTWERSSTAFVWDVATGASCALAHGGTVRGAVWDRAGIRVLSWANDGTVTIWDDPCAGDRRIIQRYDRAVEGAQWSQDETKILSWSSDNTARIWRAGTPEPIFVLEHGGPVIQARWSQDETKILSTSLDNAIQIWTVVETSGSVRQPVLDLIHPQKVNGAVWDSSQTRILTWAVDGQVRLWDANQVEAPLSGMQHEGAVNGAAWNADESQILSWSADRTVRLWLDNGQPVGNPMRHDSNVLGAAWSADGSRILSWSDDNTARLWRSADQTLVAALTHDGAVLGAAWSQDEGQILTWSGDGTLRLWAGDTGTAGALMRHEGSVLGAAFSPDETRILSWSVDGSIRLWSDAGAPVLNMPHEGAVLGAAWDPSGRRVLSWTRGNQVLVWDAFTGQQLAALPHGNSSFGVQGAVWNRDGSRILSWSSNGVVRIWNVPGDNGRLLDGTSDLLRNTLQHRRFVVGARWNADETRVLSWSADDTARIWDVSEPRRNEVLFVLQQRGAVSGADWDAEQRRVLTWNVAGVVKQWVVDVETLIEIGRGWSVEPLTNTERASFFLSVETSTAAPVPLTD